VDKVGVLDGLRVNYLLLWGLKCKTSDDVRTTSRIAILFVQISPHDEIITLEHTRCN
jgi:hypothetical protein